MPRLLPSPSWVCHILRMEVTVDLKCCNVSIKEMWEMQSSENFLLTQNGSSQCCMVHWRANTALEIWHFQTLSDHIFVPVSRMWFRRCYSNVMSESVFLLFIYTQHMWPYKLIHKLNQQLATIKYTICKYH